MLRLLRTMLMGVGLVTTVRAVLDPEVRNATLSKLGERFPIDGLLEEIAVEVAAARSAFADADAQAAAASAADGEDKPAGQRPRRPVNRSRGDTNGQRGRKPPNRGTRTA